MGDFNDLVLQKVAKAQIKVRARQDNVAGVKLPIFEHYVDGNNSYELHGKSTNRTVHFQIAHASWFPAGFL